MTERRDWEIPAWGDPEPLDQSDFVGWRSRNGEFDSPMYLWLEGDGKPTVCLSNTSDAYEKIQLCNAQDIDDLISRLARAKKDVFGEQIHHIPNCGAKAMVDTDGERPRTPIIDSVARYLQLKDFDGNQEAAEERWQEGFEPDDYKESYRKDAREIFNIIAAGILT